MAASCQFTAPARCSTGRRRFMGSLSLLRDSQSQLVLEAFGKNICERREVTTKRGSLKVRCQQRAVSVVEKDETVRQNVDGNSARLSVVMKFGGSSVASAERMREVAELILSFPEERPVIVLSAMGKTTNKLLLAGEEAVRCGVSHVSEIDELSFIKELHLKTVAELGVDMSTVSGLYLWWFC